MEVEITNEALDVHQGYVYMQMIARNADEQEAARMLYAVRHDIGNDNCHSYIMSLEFPLGYEQGIARQLFTRLAQDVGPSFEFDLDKELSAQADIENRFTYPVVHPVLYDVVERGLDLRRDMANVTELAAEGKLTGRNTELLLERRMATLDDELTPALNDLAGVSALEIRSFNPKTARTAYSYALKRIETLGKGINETPAVPMLDNEENHAFSRAGLCRVRHELGEVYTALTAKASRKKQEAATL